MTEGYAFKLSDGVIAIETVGPSERSAKVNALFLYDGVFVNSNWSDGMINQFFAERLSDNGSVIPVTISEKN